MHTSRTVEARTPAAVQIHYTVKTNRPTPSPPTATHSSRQNVLAPVPQSLFPATAGRSSQTSSPMASVPYPAQPHAPKASPARAEARPPSPNYFGLIVEPTADPRDSASLPTQNWSPPSSSIRSFAAALPMPVPLDANPDFEAFKRQIDIRTKGFGLSGHGGISAIGAGGSREYSPSPNAGPARPRIGGRWSTYNNASDQPGSPDHGVTRTLSGVWEHPRSRMDLDPVHEPGAFFADEPKSKLDSPSGLPPFTLKMPPASLRTPPASLKMPPVSLKMPPVSLKMPPAVGRMQRMERAEGADARTELSRSEDRDPRLSVMGNRLEMPSPPTGRPQIRSETVPAKMNDVGPMMLAPAQLRALLEDGPVDQVLLLDIRSSQSFSQSHVFNALNLCVPTTLLKRASYNLEKLKQNFYNPADKERFARWSEFKYMVVYDGHSTEKTEAAAAVNMVKKFTNEGYGGQTFILRGGFNVFQEAYPDLVELPADDMADAGGAGPCNMAPVIGGVMLPASTTANASNPFFGNIRQNMDLADGVGQLEVSRPAGLEPLALPQWLRTAVAQPDKGKMVADKFLKIEREEQSRMQRVYASFGAASTQQPSVQISGIEQGVKNRYKDILPFEHTRVKLQGRPSGGCDYINASHIRASRSNKRYIATQGPLPATFDDFWSVVWDQDVRVLVMLTAEFEGGQLKCHSYWKSSDYGPIRLKLLSEKKVSLDVDRHRSDSTSSSAQPEPFGRRRANTTTSLDATEPPGNAPAQSDSHYVIVRKFALSHASHPFSPMREITHLHYPSWPDFGAPARPSHLLALVELTNVTQRFSVGMDTTTPSGANSSPTAKRDAPETAPFASFSSQQLWAEEPERDARARPVLVHCSAGCGRTGTFCAVDSVIDMLKRQRNAAAGANRAAAAPTPNKDAQGDVVMGGAGPVHASPVTTSAPGGFFSASPTTVRRPSNASVSSAAGRQSDSTLSLDTSWLGDTSLDLIQQTVEDFRGQRISMVQSLRQFVLCYETVTEWAWRSQERGAGAGAVGGLVRSATTDGGVMSRGGGRSRARSGSLGVGRMLDG